MKKFNIFFNIEKEEQWLNEQLKKGYQCTHISVFGQYTFQKTTTKYVMRLDCQDYLSKDTFTEYKGMYEDFGWQHVDGYRFGGIQYWQKESDEHNEIFSDRQSRKSYYKRIMAYSFILGLILLPFSVPPNNSSLYHRGLWDMEGFLFLKAFLFETPFALLKLLPMFFVVLLGYSYYKAYRKYSMLKNQ